ncbi:MAG: hypothetical protein AB7U30_09165 [Sulfuricellaceae bacterium]|jgi:hypothetical protein
MVSRGYFNEEDNLPVCWAVVYAPKQNRKRFPENCVKVVGSAEEALAAADSASGHHAARVAGPSRSSEGFRLYYLLEWL